MTGMVQGVSPLIADEYLEKILICLANFPGIHVKDEILRENAPKLLNRGFVIHRITTSLLEVSTVGMRRILIGTFYLDLETIPPKEHIRLDDQGLVIYTEELGSRGETTVRYLGTRLRLARAYPSHLVWEGETSVPLPPISDPRTDV